MPNSPIFVPNNMPTLRYIGLILAIACTSPLPGRAMTACDTLITTNGSITYIQVVKFDSLKLYYIDCGDPMPLVKSIRHGLIRQVSYGSPESQRAEPVVTMETGDQLRRNSLLVLATGLGAFILPFWILTAGFGGLLLPIGCIALMLITFLRGKEVMRQLRVYDKYTFRLEKRLVKIGMILASGLLAALLLTLLLVLLTG